MLKILVQKQTKFIHSYPYSYLQQWYLVLHNRGNKSYKTDFYSDYICYAISYLTHWILMTPYGIT